MECNKDEAIRARDIAERKMQINDFVAARKIVLKAQQLFPDLENVSQMLTVCDVHCSAELKISISEKDWYGVLQVEQNADEISIKKQYRKLALLLHPDKNKFPGAEAAFKLIGEAQRVLSDPGLRKVYDMKRKATPRNLVRRQPQTNKNARKQTVQNSFTNATAPFPGFSIHPQQQQTQTGSTFWTTCPFCGVKYQYYRNLLDKLIRCQQCMRGFAAHDVNAPGVRAGSNMPNTWNQYQFPQQKENSSWDAHKVGQQSTTWNFSSSGGVQADASRGATVSKPFSETVSGFGVGSGSKTTVAADQNADKEVRKEAENRTKFATGNAAEVKKRAQMTKPSGSLRQKRGRKDVVESSESCDTDSTDREDDAVDVPLAKQNVEVTTSCNPRRSVRQRQHVTYNENGSDDDDFVNPKGSKKSRASDGADTGEAASEEDANRTRDITGLKEINNNEAEVCHSSEETLPNGEEKAWKLKKNGLEQAGLGIGEEKERFKATAAGRCEANSSSGLSPEEMLDPETIVFPEPEFYDFDKDRAEEKFAVDQMWTVYDNSGGMPRYYARIRKVYSGKFKLRITWLEPDPNPENECEVDWVNSELPVACGIFKIGSTQDTEQHEMFSHLASWEKSTGRSRFKIYPRKGDIWALFKGWNIKWGSNPHKHGKYEFEIVEVLSDYAEGTGVEVAHLVKLKGFTSLFQKKIQVTSYQIPPDELFRFSHKIPSYTMTRKERENIPERTFELDPASVPNGLEESAPSPICNNVKVDLEHMDGRHNVPHSSGAEQTKAPEMHTDANANSVKEENLDNGVCGSSRTNGTSDKKNCKAKASHCVLDKGKNLDSENGGVDGFSDNKLGEASEAKCPDEKGRHVDDGTVGQSSPEVSLENYECPDPEFHKFEKTIDDFQPGQIWALYSEGDGLPKYYGRIKKVLSESLKLQLKWLELDAISEEEIRWSEGELAAGCGTFKTEGDDETVEIPMFSHLVQAIPVPKKKNKYKIFPRKGDIWALYENWTPGGPLPDMDNCDYEIVEVLEATVSMLRVMVLGKVEGYNSVFRRAGNTKDIPQNELLRFSHRIPAFRLTEERGGKLRGYFELDPASVPTILFCTSKD